MEFEDGARANSVRFVLLLHALPEAALQSTHWDLMIHQHDSLLTFALLTLPPQTSCPEGVVWSATRLPNHRVRYLDYEGPIGPAQPGGSDRGRVRRVAAGWAVCEVAPQAERPHRWQLRSPELQAVFAYKPCAVGEDAQLHFEIWHGLLSSP